VFSYTQEIVDFRHSSLETVTMNASEILCHLYVS